MVTQGWSHTGLDYKEVNANTLSKNLAFMATHKWTVSYNKAKAKGQLNYLFYICIIYLEFFCSTLA